MPSTSQPISQANTGETPYPVKLLLVDDEPEFLKLLQRLVSKESRLAVAGKASTAEEALEVIPKLAPNAVVMDVNMPGMGGLKGAAHILRKFPEVAVVLMSDTRERLYSASAREIGATAFIPKKGLTAEVILQALGTTPG